MIVSRLLYCVGPPSLFLLLGPRCVLSTMIRGYVRHLSAQLVHVLWMTTARLRLWIFMFMGHPPGPGARPRLQYRPLVIPVKPANPPFLRLACARVCRNHVGDCTSCYHSSAIMHRHTHARARARTHIHAHELHRTGPWPSESFPVTAWWMALFNRAACLGPVFVRVRARVCACVRVRRPRHFKACSNCKVQHPKPQNKLNHRQHLPFHLITPPHLALGGLHVILALGCRATA